MQMQSGFFLSNGNPIPIYQYRGGNEPSRPNDHQGASNEASAKEYNFHSPRIIGEPKLPPSHNNNSDDDSKIIATPIAAGRRKKTGSGDDGSGGVDDRIILNDNDDSQHFVTPVPGYASRVLLDKHPHRDEIESLLELSSANNGSAISNQTRKKPPSPMGIRASTQGNATMHDSINYSTPNSKANLPFASPTNVVTASDQRQNDLDATSKTGNTNNNNDITNSHSRRTILRDSNPTNPKQHYLQTISTLQQIRDQLRQEAVKAKSDLQNAKQQLEHAQLIPLSREQQTEQPTFNDDSPKDLSIGERMMNK